MKEAQTRDDAKFYENRFEVVKYLHFRPLFRTMARAVPTRTRSIGGASFLALILVKLCT